MLVTFTGKSVHVTDREREYAEKKLQRLARYFRSAREAHLIHSVQRNQQIVEVQLDLDGVLLRAEERAPDIFAAIDGVAEAVCPANVAFMGFPVPAGTHIVKLEYRPPSFAWWAALSVLTWVALSVWALFLPAPTRVNNRACPSKT